MTDHPHGGGLSPRLGLGHDSGWSGLSSGQSVGYMTTGGSSMYDGMREGAAPVSFGEIADATVDEMFGRGGPFRRTAARAANRTFARRKKVGSGTGRGGGGGHPMRPPMRRKGQMRAGPKRGQPSGGTVRISRPMQPGQPYEDPSVMMGPYEKATPGSDMLNAEIDALLAEDYGFDEDDDYGFDEDDDYGFDEDDDYGEEDDDDVFGVMISKSLYPQLLEGKEARLFANIDGVNINRLQRLYADQSTSFWFKVLAMDEIEKRGAVPNDHGDTAVVAANFGLYDDALNWGFGSAGPIKKMAARAAGEASARCKMRRRGRTDSQQKGTSPPPSYAPMVTSPVLNAPSMSGVAPRYGYAPDDNYGFSPNDAYGGDTPPQNQVVVHGPPSGGTFNEALKTGLGFGVGFMTVYLGVAVLGGLMSGR